MVDLKPRYSKEEFARRGDEIYERRNTKMISLKHGEKSNGNVATAKVKIKTHDDYAAIVLLAIPNLDEVKGFAAKLHAKGKAWKGEAFGWQAEYNPQRPEPPLDSKMTFTPADFRIGESGIWFFSLMWEHGNDAEPVEFLDDRNILKKTARRRRIRRTVLQE